MSRQGLVPRKQTNYTSDLILPNQPYHDEFLHAVTKLLGWLRWFGVSGKHGLIWKLWTIAIILLLVAIEIEAIWKVIKALAGWAIDMAGQRSVAARFAGTLFYSAALISLIQCWKISRSWDDISAYWASVELSLNIKQVPADKTLKKRTYCIVAFLSTFCLFEHIMSVLSSYDFDCTSLQCLRHYVTRSHGFLILETEYNEWIAIPVVIMSNIATVLFNLPDILILVLSLGLSSRYKRLNQCVETVCGMNKANQRFGKNNEIIKVYTWRKIREAYVKQAMLVREVDGVLSSLILSSSFFNFYFLCLSCFLLVTHGMDGTVLSQIYCFVSLLWLVIKNGSCVLAAADVNRCSKLALPYLYDCQPKFYNIEIERLQKQLNKENIALSGMGFFYLTRSIVLQIGGAVITYVLVLIQYDDTNQSITE